MASGVLTKTLILEVSLPDFNCEDAETWDEFYDGDMICALSDEAGLCSQRVNITFLHGDKGGTSILRTQAEIVGARVVAREPGHELSDDSRLDELETDAIRDGRLEHFGEEA